MTYVIHFIRQNHGETANSHKIQKKTQKNTKEEYLQNIHSILCPRRLCRSRYI